MTVPRNLFNKPRGIRNNNPGNIRDNDQNKAVWLGEIEHGANDDKDFLVFKDEVSGIRALIVLINTYRRKYGVTNIAQLITKYAPSNENNTTAYINQVAKKIGVNPQHPINFDAYMYRVVKAIIEHENGVKYYDFYTDEQFAEALARA